MTKSQFKKQYSAYRKMLKERFGFGREAYCDALHSNQFLRKIYQRNVRPVSIKCWLAFNK